jgi:hypothetical protein
MKYSIQQFKPNKVVYYVIFDNVNDTSSKLFKNLEDAKKALELNYGKPAANII